MRPFNILVFPCGSEIGLEIYRSLRYSRHFNLIGASSIDDHGKFVFNNYIGDLPFVDDESLISRLSEVIKEMSIDAIYPTMDSVIQTLKENEEKLGCKVVSSSLETVSICSSKKRTYEILKDIVPVPMIFDAAESISSFPIFAKPDVGYGSRGARKIETQLQLCFQQQAYPNSIFLEFLPGKEYTVDCFTNRDGKLLFTGKRERKRIMNGISVNTSVSVIDDEILSFALKINEKIKFRGAWFFQIKENDKGDPVLLEIASRMAGSSAVYRCQGVNFALLSLFDLFDKSIEIIQNKFLIQLDRALENRYKIDFEFHTVYVDFDDALLIDGKINIDLVKALFQFFNEGKKLILITKHENNIHETLKRYRISELFDEVIHLHKSQFKYEFINISSSIFIDDSFTERKEIYQKANIPVFAPDAIEALIT